MKISVMKKYLKPLNIGYLIVAIYALLAIFAPLLPLKDPKQIYVDDMLAKPSADFLFGTDLNGMDVLSRTIYAARLDLSIAFAAVFLALLLGIAIGALTGFVGGFIDTLVARILDLFQAYPVLILALAISGIASDSLITVVFIITLVDAPVFIRLVRSEVIRIKSALFVESAKALGNSDFKIVFRHILPIALPPVLIQIPIRIAYSINIVAAMAFVGVGIQPPTPEWGSMIKIGTPYISSGEWWMAIFPGLAIFGICLALNLISDELQKKSLRSRS
jgi:peptide/nickel transport system permease protein